MEKKELWVGIIGRVLFLLLFLILTVWMYIDNEILKAIFWLLNLMWYSNECDKFLSKVKRQEIWRRKKR